MSLATSWGSFRTQFCKNYWQLQIAVLKQKSNLYWVILLCSIINDHCLDCSKGRNQTILELFFNRREPNFSQNISAYINFDGASLILVLPSPPPLKKIIIKKNGLIFVDAVNSHWARETGWSKRAEDVKCWI